MSNVLESTVPEIEPENDQILEVMGTHRLDFDQARQIVETREAKKRGQIGAVLKDAGDRLTEAKAAADAAQDDLRAELNRQASVLDEAKGLVIAYGRKVNELLEIRSFGMTKEQEDEAGKLIFANMLAAKRTPCVATESAFTESLAWLTARQTVAPFVEMSAKEPAAQAKRLLVETKAFIAEHGINLPSLIGVMVADTGSGEARALNHVRAFSELYK